MANETYDPQSAENGDRYIRLRDAAALYLEPDNPDAGLRLIDAHVARLARRVRTVRIAVAIGVASLALAVFALSYRPGKDAIMVGFALACLALVMRTGIEHAIFNPSWPWHARLAFLWPREPDKLRAFMDLLASGEITAYCRE
jgi:hypothetical protein